MIFTMYKNKKNHWKYKFAAVLLALLFWQLLTLWVGEQLLLPSPLRVIERLSVLTKEREFFSTIFYSTRRILLGMVLGIFFSGILGALAGKYAVLETIFYPYVLAMKSVPVASFIILALVWVSSKKLSSFISFLMIFPIVYENVLQGIRSVDQKMLQMCDVFEIFGWKRMRYLYIPNLRPFILSALSSGIGVAWKAGIAAEVIGIPDGSIGNKLYRAKIYFETADLFAWTLVIVLLSVCIEKLFVLMLRKIL
jgi:putative ABC transporter, permease protein